MFISHDETPDALSRKVQELTVSFPDIRSDGLVRTLLLDVQEVHGMNHTTVTASVQEAMRYGDINPTQVLALAMDKGSYNVKAWKEVLDGYLPNAEGMFCLTHALNAMLKELPNNPTFKFVQDIVQVKNLSFHEHIILFIVHIFDTFTYIICT